MIASANKVLAFQTDFVARLRDLLLRRLSNRFRQFLDRAGFQIEVMNRRILQRDGRLQALYRLLDVVQIESALKADRSRQQDVT